MTNVLEPISNKYRNRFFQRKFYMFLGLYCERNSEFLLTIFRGGFVRRLGRQGRRQVLKIARFAEATVTYPDSEHSKMQIQTVFDVIVPVSGSVVKTT